MKKMAMILMIAATMFASLACAENTTDALEAFSTLTGMNVTLDTVALTSDEYLDKVMADAYLNAPADAATASQMALELPGLSAVTTKDIAVYAAAKQYPAAQVRNKYFRSLANVLRAEIMVNPASEETYKNVQVILSLFLDESDADTASRNTIRSTITGDHARVIADSYNLPASFVEFIVMDDNWNDDNWENDNAWQTGGGVYNTDDLYLDSLEDYIDTDGIAGNSVDNTPDYYTPDYNTPDYNTPDYNTPDYNTPDYNTPDYNTPDYNTPDYNSPAGSRNSYDS